LGESIISGKMGTKSVPLEMNEEYTTMTTEPIDQLRFSLVSSQIAIGTMIHPNHHCQVCTVLYGCDGSFSM
jgi:hypothetical protein